MGRRAAAAVLLLVAGLVLPAALPPGWPQTAGIRAYDEALSRYVVHGSVDYDGFARHRSGLDSYLREIATVDSAALGARSQAEQKAFWINVYNALTLDLVLRNLRGPDGKGPRLKSIRDIPEAFTRPRWVVAGARRSLDGIEKGTLLARFDDPRIHFALVCASRSCPALRRRAYTGASLDAELDYAVRAFLADTLRSDTRAQGDTLRLSRIFEWYRGDFLEGVLLTPPPFFSSGPEVSSLLTYLVGHRYLPERTHQWLRDLNVANIPVHIEFLPYDWSLNDAGPRR